MFLNTFSLPEILVLAGTTGTTNQYYDLGSAEMCSGTRFTPLWACQRSAQLQVASFRVLNSIPSFKGHVFNVVSILRERGACIVAHPPPILTSVRYDILRKK